MNMKTIRYTLLVLLACLSLSGCQDVEEPANTVPTVITDVVEKYSGEFAYLTGTVSSRAECYFLISTSEDMSDAQKVEVYPYKNEEKGSWTCNRELGDLTPGTTYYVVLCATDGRSEVKGNVVSFTTSAYLSIESVKVDGKEGGWDILGAYLTSADQYANSKYGNMRIIRNGNGSYELPYSIMLTEPSYKVYAYDPYNEGNSPETLKEINVWTNGTNNCLYGSCEVTPSSPKANIEMKSALAKLYFTISTDSKEPISISYINLRNVDQQSKTEALSISGKLDLTTGKITPVPVPGHDGILLNMPNTPIYAGVHANAEMLVIPTSFKDGEIEIGVSVNSQFIRTTLPAATWEAGKTYEIPLKINVETNKAKVGDYYYSDGTYSSTYYSAANSNKVCVGIVFALSKEQGGDIDVSLSSSEHGRIVALKDAGISDAILYPYSSNPLENYVITPYFTALDKERISGYLPYDGKSAYRGWVADTEKLPYNYSNWVKTGSGPIIRTNNYALLDYDGEKHTYSMTNFKVSAMELCINYPVASIKWYLPSIGELARLGMAIGMQLIDSQKQNGFVNPLSESYWSSTVNSKTIVCNIWRYNFGDGGISAEDQDNKYGVRPIASF